MSALSNIASGLGISAATFGALVAFKATSNVGLSMGAASLLLAAWQQAQRKLSGQPVAVAEGLTVAGSGAAVGAGAYFVG